VSGAWTDVAEAVGSRYTRVSEYLSTNRLSITGRSPGPDLVHRCDEHINSEFREFLVGVGCNVATIAQAGY
jgi:hypothetical protein